MKKRKRSGQALLFTLLCEIKKEVERAKEANLENLSPESEQQFVKSYRFILDEGFELNREKEAAEVKETSSTDKKKRSKRKTVKIKELIGQTGKV